MSKARGLADLGNVYDDGALSNRNLIINGAMQVWQRGTSGFSHNVYSADRWEEQTNTNDVLSVSRVEAPSSGETGLPRQFTYMANFALTAGTTGNLNDLRQRVENPKGLAGQTLTLSYYIKASSSCTINNRRIGWNGVTNAPPATNLPSLNVTTGWQRVENTFTLGSSGTAVYSASSHLDVILGLPVNTTVDVYITGVQLETGDTATPFEHRSYGQEMALCQRFFQKVYVTSVSGILYTPNGDTRHNSIQFGMMRGTPSVTPPSAVNHSINFSEDGTGVNTPIITYNVMAQGGSSGSGVLMFVYSSGTLTGYGGTAHVASFGMQVYTTFSLDAEL